ncbi:MAG: helix-turn-helix transcriptional regulator [Spirochaetales bacterium]|nr:helix-turn-helix transcriptional regulator [Spirochaetales bacterium]
MGGLNSREQLGAGIMHKPGEKEDTFDRSFSIFALVYVARGRGVYRDNRGNSFDLRPGSVFQRLPGIPHSTILDPESRWMELYIDMGPQLSRALMESRFIREDRPVLSLSPDSRLQERFYRYYLSLKECPERDLNRMVPEALNLMNHIYTLASQDSDSLDEWERIDDARNHFFDHCEKRINIEEFCRDRGWGYEWFRKAFKKNTALSPGQFIIQRRIDRACEWLLASELSVREIGDRLGYPSPFEFSHQFKKVTGLSPREYRQNRKQEKSPSRF